MIGIVKRVFEPGALVQMRRKAERDPTPRGTIELCRLLMRHGRREDAAELAREGLQRWPRCSDLRDLLASGFRNEGHGEFSLVPQPKFGSKLTLPDWAAHFDHLIGFEELDVAIDGLSEFLVEFADRPEARALARDLHFRRLRRDHMREDARDAIQHGEAAVALEPKSSTARLALAEILLYIGAPGRAMLHLYAARDQTPDDPRVEAAIRGAQEWPLEKQDLEELLRDLEDRDGPADTAGMTFLPVPSMRRDGWLQRLSLFEGVRRVALIVGAEAVLAGEGFIRPASSDKDRSFVSLAEGFRRAALLSSKRMGIGTLQEATIQFETGLAHFVAAGTVIVLVELAATPSSGDVGDAARDLVSCLTGGMIHA